MEEFRRIREPGAPWLVLEMTHNIGADLRAFALQPYHSCNLLRYASPATLCSRDNPERLGICFALGFVLPVVAAVSRICLVLHTVKPAAGLCLLARFHTLLRAIRRDATCVAVIRIVTLQFSSCLLDICKTRMSLPPIRSTTHTLRPGQRHDHAARSLNHGGNTERNSGNDSQG